MSWWRSSTRMSWEYDCAPFGTLDGGYPRWSYAITR